MQLQEFTNILQHPETLSSDQSDAIAKVVSEYPYFQPARALYLKDLKNKSSFRYNNALKVTAAYTADRSVLFDYITSEEFKQNEISKTIKHNSQYLKDVDVNAVDDISVNRSVTIDDALKQQIRDTEGVLDPNLFQQKEQPVQTELSSKFDNPIIDIDVKNIAPEDKLNIGKPLEFDKSETYSFSEWLKITDFKPIVRKEEVSETAEVHESEAPLDKKRDIIDRFLTTNPKIKPTSSIPKPRLISIETSGEDSLMTETLARIYLEQKNYDKAIQSYKILSLKYPEKSSFFADQIKAVEELKENNNTGQ